jgi:hypothetical protein
MTHFVLVHGGWHGAWCWPATVEALTAAGHRASAVQLPSDQPGLGARAYAEVIAAAVQPAGSVVVGHSLAGLAIPLVPTLAPVRALVYLAALLPLPGCSWRDQLAASRPMAAWFNTRALPTQVRDEQGRTSWPADTARQLFYPDCAPAVAEAAVSQLRSQAPAPVTETTPVTDFPAVPAHYVGCRDDRAVSATWAKQASTERLGVRPVWLGGSHSPFLSRPAELAQLLATLTGAARPCTEVAS